MSEQNILEIKDLHVNVEDKEILHGVNLEIGKDEVHVLMDQTAQANPHSDMQSPDILDIPSHQAALFLAERISQRCL